MTLLQDVLAVLSGSLVGFSLGLIGGGGSVLAVPLLVYVVGVKSPHVAIGTSALAVAANAAFNLYSHWRTGTSRSAAPSPMPCSASPAPPSARPSARRSTATLLALFGVVMIVIAASMVSRPPSAGHPEVKLNRGRPATWCRASALAALATGFLSGFFGIGGGFLIVPGLVIATGMPLINAIASSLVSVTSFGATTAANYALSGLVDWWIVLLLLAGGAVGGFAGTATARHLADQRRMLATAFAVIVGAVGVYVVWRGMAAIFLLPASARRPFTKSPYWPTLGGRHYRSIRAREAPPCACCKALFSASPSPSGRPSSTTTSCRPTRPSPLLEKQPDRQLGRARPAGERPARPGAALWDRAFGH